MDQTDVRREALNIAAMVSRDRLAHMGTSGTAKEIVADAETYYEFLNAPNSDNTAS